MEPVVQEAGSWPPQASRRLPPTSEFPVRIELIDTIESLRLFDLNTQRSRTRWTG
jgi:hypothetical protein